MKESNSFNNNKIKSTFSDFVEKYAYKNAIGNHAVNLQSNSPNIIGYGVDFMDNSIVISTEDFYSIEFFSTDKEFSEEVIFILFEISSYNLCYLFKKYDDLDFIISKYNEIINSSDYFVDWFGQDDYRGLICRDGKFLSLFSGKGYQLSYNIDGTRNCGSSSGMAFLNCLEYEYSGTLKIFTDYFINSCINSSYTLSSSSLDTYVLTDTDRNILEEFKEIQSNHFNSKFKYIGKMEEVKLPSELIFDNKGYQVYLSDDSLYLVCEKKEIILSIDSDILRNIRFENFYKYENSDKVDSNIKTYESIIETLLIISDNFEHNSIDLRFFEAKDFTKILIDTLWEFNKWVR